MAAQFFQYIFDTIYSTLDITHPITVTLNYLKSAETSEIPPQDLILHIHSSWPSTLKDKQVQRRTAIILQNYCSKYGEESAFSVFNAVKPILNDNDNSQYIKNILGSVPVLFFEYDEFYKPLSKRFVSFYEVLNDEQRIRYARKALLTNGYLIRDVPQRARSTALYRIAVSTSPCAIQFVPKRKRSSAMIEKAVRNSGYALEYLTKQQQHKYIEMAILNTGHEETHWPSDFWLPRRQPKWLKELFKRYSEKDIKNWRSQWKEKQEQMVNRWHGERAM